MANIVWVTRPEAHAKKTARALQNVNATPLISPVLELIEDEHAKDLCASHDNATPIIVTSQYALAILARYTTHRARPLYVTGEILKRKALTFGFTHVRTAKGDARSILPILTNNTPYIIYAHGNHTAFDMPSALHERGILCTPLLCYHSRCSAIIDDTVLSALHHHTLDAILCYSIFSAQCLHRLLHHHKMQIEAYDVPLYCISPIIAQHCKEMGFKHVFVHQPAHIIQAVGGDLSSHL